ncbi:MAG: response regulator [Candidatus Omnitrophota bacterium]
MWKVLIVDDNFENRELMAEILRDVAECDLAVSGQEAIEKYNNALSLRPYQVILLDIMMPDVDGLQALRIIRKNERDHGIELGDGVPVIMVTAHKKPYLDAFFQGCTDYIMKPIDPAKLIKKIEEKVHKPYVS